MARVNRYAKYLVGLFLIFALASGALLWWQGSRDGSCPVAQLSEGEDIKGEIEVGQDYFKIGELVPIIVRLTFDNRAVQVREEDLKRMQLASFELNSERSFETCAKGSRTGIVFSVNGQILSHLPAEFRPQPIEIAYTLKNTGEVQLLHVPWPPEFSMKSAITENTFVKLTPEKSQKGFLLIVLGAAMAMSIAGLGLHRFLLRKKTSLIAAQDNFDFLFPKWRAISSVREKLQYAYFVVSGGKLSGRDEKEEELIKLCSASFAKDFSDKTVEPPVEQIEARLRKWSKEAVSQKRGEVN